MAFVYVVLGAGLQGTAAAYDLAKHGDAAKIILADADLARARSAANRVNELCGRAAAEARQVDVSHAEEVTRLLVGANACLSAVPYYFNVSLTKAAIAAGCHFNDLGGNTAVVFEQHQHHEAARKAGISVIPDCGLAPGMANILAAHAVSRLSRPRKAMIRVGGLPQHPKPPLQYALSFNIAGLTNEYFGTAYVLRGGKVAEVNAFSELEEIEFPSPVGRCEAFMTVGGTSTCPWTFAGRLQEFDEKTVRYPGHYEKMRVLYELGLFDTRPVRVNGFEVSPREVFHAVAGPKLLDPDLRDVVVLRVSVIGEDGMIEMEMLDFYDEATHFSAMQRTTGFGAAIITIMQAMGQFPAGCLRLEEVVDGGHYLEAMQSRGFALQVKSG